MDQTKRTELLQNLQEVMQGIIAETKGDVKSYDEMTQQVSHAIAETKENKANWNDLQWKMFRIYLDLL